MTKLGEYEVDLHWGEIVRLIMLTVFYDHELTDSDWWMVCNTIRVIDSIVESEELDYYDTKKICEFQMDCTQFLTKYWVSEDDKIAKVLTLEELEELL